MRKTIVLIDAGFLIKLAKHFGGGRYLKFDIVSFARRLAKSQGFLCDDVRYYIAPPFCFRIPTEDEKKRRDNYDKFVRKMREQGVEICEGRCQRLKEDGEFVYRQKGVDVLLAIDLVSLPVKLKLDRVILIASDSDFVPAVNRLREFGIKTVLYTFYEKVRDSRFSRSNELIKSVDKYVCLEKEDFEDGD